MLIKRKNRENGRMFFQALSIKKSYRYRGKQHRIQTNKKHNIIIFAKNELFPKKIQIVKKFKKIIIPYSQIKIKEKTPPPYSTLKPETSSDSPSEKSKGVRFLSAKIIKIHPIKNKNLILKNQKLN
jgi:hypothetical protein